MQFVDNREKDNVNVRDFFLHVFKVLTAPESELLMFNETETVCWFPPKVQHCYHRSHLAPSLCQAQLWRRSCHMVQYDGCWSSVSDTSCGNTG